MKLFLILLFLSLLFPKIALAVTLTIQNYPSQITKDPFEFDVIINGAKKATNYLEIDLFKEGSTNYFGETWNGSNWYQGTSAKDYFPIEIRGASTSAHLKGRVEEEDLESGDYKLKVRRYTQSGSLASLDHVNIVDIKIAIPTPPPTPIPKTPSPSPTETPLPTALPQTSTPAPKPQVLSISKTPDLNPKTKEENSQKRNPIGIILIVGGIIAVISGASYGLFIKKRGRDKKDSL